MTVVGYRYLSEDTGYLVGATRERPRDLGRSGGVRGRRSNSDLVNEVALRRACPVGELQEREPD